jgi:hypothetical protein
VLKNHPKKLVLSLLVSLFFVSLFVVSGCGLTAENQGPDESAAEDVAALSAAPSPQPVEATATTADTASADLASLGGEETDPSACSCNAWGCCCWIGGTVCCTHGSTTFCNDP